MNNTVKRGTTGESLPVIMTAAYCTGCGISKLAMDSARAVGVTWAKYDGACCGELPRVGVSK